MSISEQAYFLSGAQFWIFMGMAAAASLVALYYAFRNLRRARIIEDIPTARIRSAQQGYVELHGEALGMPPKLQMAPLSATPCCWFRYKIEKRHDKGWRPIEARESGAPFIIKDDTGECLVLPEGASVTTDDKRVWLGDSRYPNPQSSQRPTKPTSTLKQVGDLLNTDISMLSGQRYRYSEEYIFPGDRLYAMGLFKSLDDLDHASAHKAISTDILREWKSDQKELLKRFDLDRDGKISPSEWERARKEALQLAEDEQQHNTANQIPHSLGATDSNTHPFLLSTMPEFELVKKYRFWALVTALASFASGTAAVLMFTRAL